MPEITEIENLAAVTPEKPKRIYKPRTKPPIVEAVAEVAAPVAIPPPPNPTILALEADILELVRHRSAALNEVAASGHALNAASARMASAKEKLQQLEQEVQYRMALIAQMRGERGPDVYAAPPMHMYQAPAAPILSDYAAKMMNQAYRESFTSDIPNGQGVYIPPGVSSIPSGSGQSGYVPQRQPRTESAEDVRAAM